MLLISIKSIFSAIAVIIQLQIKIRSPVVQVCYPDPGTVLNDLWQNHALYRIIVQKHQLISLIWSCSSPCIVALVCCWHVFLPPSMQNSLGGSEIAPSIMSVAIALFHMLYYYDALHVRTL